MINPKHNDAPSDIDVALAHLEQGATGTRLREACAATSLPPDAAERLEQRLVARISDEPVPQAAKQRRVLLPWWHQYRGRSLALGAVFALVVAVALIALLRRPPVAAAAVVERAAEASVAVPPGQVRHLVYSSVITSTLPGSVPFVQQEEVWLAAGARHPLMRKVGPLPGWQVVVDENDVWLFMPSSEDKTVLRQPFNELYLREYVPGRKVLETMIGERDMHIAGESTLDGRRVLVVERVAAAPPPDLPPGDDVIDVRAWIDADTYQVVQWQTILRQVVDGRFVGKADWQTYRLLRDELLPRKALPADLFTFTPPPGATVQPPSR